MEQKNRKAGISTSEFWGAVPQIVAGPLAMYAVANGWFDSGMTDVLSVNIGSIVDGIIVIASTLMSTFALRTYTASRTAVKVSGQ